MKSRSIVLTLVLLSAMCAILASCTVTQEIRIFAAGAGEARLRVTLAPVFTRYLLDLSEAVEDPADGKKEKIFRLDEISASLSERPGLTVTNLKSPKQESLELDFKFTSIGKLLTSVKSNVSRDFISVTESNGIKKVDFFLEKKNYSQLVEFFPYLKNPVFESLAPQVGEDLSESEYLDIILFALGEGGPEGVTSSIVQVKVTIDGTIVGQRGGKISGNTVTFAIPLLNILLLNKPLHYSISYK